MILSFFIFYEDGWCGLAGEARTEEIDFALLVVVGLDGLDYPPLAGIQYSHKMSVFHSKDDVVMGGETVASVTPGRSRADGG